MTMNILDNRTRATRFRLVLCASHIVTAGAFYLAHHLLMTYGLSPGDGGVLKPLAERIALAMFVFVSGLSAFIGMVLCARAHVVRLDLKGQTVVIETLAASGLGARIYKLHSGNIESANYYHGRFTAPRPSEGSGRIMAMEVEAPWITLRFRHHLLPFVLDLQAKTIDRKVLGQLAPKAVAAWRRDRPSAFRDLETTGV